MAPDDRNELVGVALFRPLEHVDVRLVVVADEIPHRLAVAVRPGVEVRADHILVSAAVTPAEAV